MERAETAVVLGQKLEEGTYRTIRSGALAALVRRHSKSYQEPVMDHALACVPRPWALPWQDAGIKGLGLFICGTPVQPWCFYCHGMSLTIRRMPPLARRWQERPCFP